MADTQTPNLGLTKIEIAGSDDTWGDKLNDNSDKLDQQVAKKTDMNSALALKADKTYVDSQDAAINAAIAGKAAIVHTHPISQVDGLQAALDAKQPTGSYAAAVHGHVISDVSGLQGVLDSKAPLDSPALTGNPTAPTPATNDNDTSIATTAYVQRELGISQSPYHDTATVTLDLSMIGKTIRLGPSVTTVVVPSLGNGGWHWGSRIDLYAQANQEITFAGGGGAIIYHKAEALPKIAGAWKGCTLHNIDNSNAGAWCLIGDLVPA